MNFRSLLLALTLPLVARSHASAQTPALFTVENNGARSERINLVFLSEGYTTADMPNFATHVTNAVNFLFSKEPWQQYRSYCNIYRIEIASNQSGCDNGNTSGANNTRDTYFNSGFYTPAVSQLLTLGAGGASKAYSLVNTLLPEADLSIVIVNDTKYGGSGGSPSVASVHASSAAVVEHEIGHTFAGLTDEYDYNYPGYNQYEVANTTAQTNRALVKWRHWFEDATPVPTPETSTYDALVGLFEGSMYTTTGWYRPHLNSLMQSLNRPCGQVNREQFVLRYYSLVHPLESFAPAASSSTVTAPSPLSFQVTPKAPSSGIALTVSWAVDGVTQAGETAAAFSRLSDFIGNGSHTVTATVHDPTPFVRLDPSGLLSESVTWNLTLSGQIPTTLAGWRTQYGADTAVSSADALPNLIKYALGLDASTPALPAQMPAGSLTHVSTDDYLTLSIARRMLRPDVTYVVEVSSDLLQWRSGAGHTVVVQDTAELLVVRDALPKSSGFRRFIRLAVQAAP